MPKKHITPKFLYSRLKQKLFEKRHPDRPWMTQDSIELLDQLITPNDIGVEYGSGRSTFWFAKRCQFLTSFEHDEQWSQIVKEKLSLLTNQNVSYLFKSLNDNPLKSEYFKSIDNFDDNSLDYIIVDGKYRDIISLKAVKKLTRGGLLVLDDSERYLPNNFNVPASIGDNIEDVNVNWKEFLKKVGTWRRIWTCDGVSTTLLLIKA